MIWYGRRRQAALLYRQDFLLLQSLEHWSTGWTDWNLALDVKGGPNWIKNNVDAPIIVNAVSV